MSRLGATRPLGRSGIDIPAMGVGTNRWSYGRSDQKRLEDTLAAALDAGTGFFDTAEAYGFGRSEKALGEAAREVGREVLMASKFAPLPYRLTAAQFSAALDRTLERLGHESLEHVPYPAMERLCGRSAHRHPDR
jgi:aryl-alcohol dehydrogenase-like predicted oxidoreductase